MTHKLFAIVLIMLLTLPIVFISVGKYIYSMLMDKPVWYEIGRIFDTRFINRRVDNEAGATCIAFIATLIAAAAAAGCGFMWFNYYRKDRQ